MAFKKKSYSIFVTILGILIKIFFQEEIKCQSDRERTARNSIFHPNPNNMLHKQRKRQ